GHHSEPGRQEHPPKRQTRNTSSRQNCHVSAVGTSQWLAVATVRKSIRHRYVHSEPVSAPEIRPEYRFSDNQIPPLDAPRLRAFQTLIRITEYALYVLDDLLCAERSASALFSLDANIAECLYRVPRCKDRHSAQADNDQVAYLSEQD